MTRPGQPAPTTRGKRHLARLSLLCTALAAAAPAFTAPPPAQLRIGWKRPDGLGVALYSAPRAGMKYQVLSPDGSLGFVGPTALRTETPCDRTVNVWYVVPPGPWIERATPFGIDVDNGQRVEPTHAIVVESPARVDPRPLSSSAFDPPAPLTRFLEGIAGERGLSDYDLRVYTAGKDKERSRYIAFVIGHPDVPWGPPFVLVAVVDVVADTPLRRLVYLEKDEDGDLFSFLAAMADLDGDGLADAVLVEHGDFKGPRLLLESGSKWRVEKGNAPGPC